MIKEAIVKIVSKEDLTYDEAYAVMNEIMSGETTATQNAAFLASLSTKSARAETTDEIAGCAAYRLERRTEIFASVRGHEYRHDPAFFRHLVKRRVGELVILPFGIAHRVYDRVAGNEDPARYVFPFKICPVLPGRREVQSGGTRNERAVGFLGEWGIYVSRAKSCLNVSHRDLLIKCGERSGKGCRSVAVHEHEVWRTVVEHSGDPAQYSLGYLEKSLAGAHYVKIVVRPDGKNVEHAVEHLAVLRADAYSAFKTPVGGERQRKRTHFYCVRSCAEHGKHLYWHVSSEIAASAADISYRWIFQKNT